jgi:hypothetical protein
VHSMGGIGKSITALRVCVPASRRIRPNVVPAEAPEMIPDRMADLTCLAEPADRTEVAKGRIMDSYLLHRTPTEELQLRWEHLGQEHDPSPTVRPNVRVASRAGAL